MRTLLCCLFIYLTVGNCAHAEPFKYLCRMSGRPYPLIVDDEHNQLMWRGRTYKIKVLDRDSCAKYGWRAERPGETFEFCTATKGYADFEENGVTIRCQQQVGPVPEEYQGHWALVSEKNEKCVPDNGPAEVTDDNIQTYHEDYCRVTAARRITAMPDPHLEVACIAGGEGGAETPVHEIWRIKQLFGKEVFLEQGPGGITFWQRCP